MIMADRDAALQQVADLCKVLDHLRREVQEATQRVERLQRSSLGGAGVRIQRMLQMTEDEVTALKVSTEQETTSLRERTRAETDRLLRETTQRCQRLEAESERRRKAAEAESAARCRQAEQESERRRLLAEQESEREIARQESEAKDRIQDYQTRGVAGLHRLMRMAGERLSSRLFEVEQEITRLMELRAEVTTQLSLAHGVLVEAINQVQQAPAIEPEVWSDGSPNPAQAADAASGPPALEGSSAPPRPSALESQPQLASSTPVGHGADSDGRVGPSTEFRPAVTAAAVRWAKTG